MLNLNAKLNYTGTVQGLELKVCGLDLDSSPVESESDSKDSDSEPENLDY